MQNAKIVLDKFYNALLKNADVPTIEAAPNPKVVEALADDLNTPLALSYLHETVNALNKAENTQERAALKSELLASAYLLGLLYNEPEAWFKGSNSDDEASEIEALIQKRAEAKKNKDWATADSIRNDLKDRGIVLEDSPSGTTWKRI